MQQIIKYLNTIKSDKIYKDGEKIFQNDGVSFVAFKEKEKKYITTVYPNALIDTGFGVTLRLEGDKVIQTCTCNDFKKHERCAHVVAAALKTCEQFKTDDEIKVDEQTSLLNLFDDYYKLSELDTRENIELILKIKETKGNYSVALACRVMGKVFAITDVRKFIIAYQKKDVLKFGKNIALSTYSFSKQDMLLLSVLDDFIKYLVQVTGKLSYRVIPVSEIGLVNLLGIYGNRGIIFEDDSLFTAKRKDVNLIVTSQVLSSEQAQSYYKLGTGTRCFIQETSLIVHTPEITNNNLDTDKELIELILKVDEVKDAFMLSLAVKSKGKITQVMDIRAFIDAYSADSPIQLGKDNPIINYSFNENDTELLTTLDDLTQFLTEISSDTNTKDIMINELGLVKLLNSYKNREIDFGGRILTVVHEDIDYQMEVILEDDAIKIQFADLFGSYYPVGSKHRLFIQNGVLYVNSIDNAFNIDPFTQILEEEEISLPRQLLGKTLEKIITPLNSKNLIKLDEEINFKQVNERLVCEIRMLDNDGDIDLYVDFNYGQYSYCFDGVPKFTEQVITNRDYDREYEILKYLYDVEHTKVSSGPKGEGHLKYEYEYAKFDLLNEIIPRVQHLAIVHRDPVVEAMMIDIDEHSLNFEIKATNRINYFEFDFDYSQLNPSEIRKILQAVKKNDKQYYVNKKNQFVSLKNKKMIEQLSIVNQIQSYQKKDQAVPLYKAIYWHRIGAELFSRYQVDETLAYAVEQLNTDVVVDNQEKFVGDLRDYQLEGVQFFKRLHKLNLNGILADEMGLGKTVQVISLLCELEMSNNLIVVPKALIINWKREIEQFAPHMTINVISGSKDKRVKLIADSKHFDINITSYSMVRQDIDEYQACEFNYVILDEAQYIKNPVAQNTQAIKLLNSNYRLALSGTPIENNVMELWSIFDFLMPEYLLTKADFNNYFYKEIKLGNEDRLSQLKKQVDPFILKRNKRTVLKELPDKIEIPMYVEMGEEQQKVYASYVALYQQQVNEEGFDGNKIQVLSMLTRLRQLAIHPQMFIEDYQGQSAKVEIIKELVTELCESNRKVLIFSQFTSMLKILEQELKKMKVKTSYLDGKTSSEQRQELIDDFNKSDTEVFLISLKAGGYGLNLTSASAVIQVDPWWNKSVERQAEDRVHRIGQKDSVSIYKIIASKTIEEKIFELQNQKDDLIESILDNQASSIASMDKHDLIDLFAVKKDN